MTINNNKQKSTLSNDDLMGLIVHSYNNYLAGIMGYSELALLECENTEVEERLKRSLESGIDAVHFGKTILASLGRLQVPLKIYSLAGLLNEVSEKQDDLNIKLNRNIKLKLDIDLDKEFKIKTEVNWFKECLLDLIEFTAVLGKQKIISLKSTIDQQSQKIKVVIHCEDIKLSDHEIKSMFQPFYSSRKLISKKDIGLAKAQGFFTQMNAVLNWQNGKGFSLDIPIES